jgi:pimeloyl-ACP methyl ester carboxylesterase
MIRFAAFAPLLLGLLIPSVATSSPLAKEIEVNGVLLPYVEQGSGEPMIFVHGALSGTSSWEPVREKIAEKYRFITYMQRYYGSTAWKDDGRRFSISTHADDLINFIGSLAAGPVHLVGWSYGGAVAAAAALKNPSLLRSLTLYEANIVSVLAAESPEGKIAREDRTKMVGPAVAANKAGDPVQAIRVMYEAVYQLPPGGFEHLPQTTKIRVLENARTMPLLFAAPQPPAITCDALRKFTLPTLVMRGEKTHAFYVLITEGIGKCVQGARHVILKNVNHDGPARDPAAFSAAIFEFLSK